MGTLYPDLQPFDHRWRWILSATDTAVMGLVARTDQRS